jgi:hypothetical protein
MTLSKVEKRVIREIHSSYEAIHNIEVLCDDFNGRFSGTKENKTAAEFILGKYEDYGFENPHLESFKFKGCETGASTLQITEPVKRNIPCLTLPMTFSGEVEAEVVFVENEKAVSTLELSDKIVMGLQRHPFISKPDSNTAGFIWMHPYPAMGPPTGCINSTHPAVSVKHEHGAMMQRLIKRYGKITVKLKTECKIFDRKSWNVCGEIHGNGETEEFVLLGGHYDGHEIAQAAFDCGSGCMAITEMGRVLSLEKENLNGNVKISCFSAEEFGYQGSKNYVKKHTNEMKNMRFTFQLDCCAGNKPQMVTTDFWPCLKTFYENLSEDLRMNIHYNQRMGPGDSRPFFEIGIPTGSITDLRLPGRMELLRTYRHTVFDTFDKIDLRSLRDAITIGAISSLRIVNNEKWPSHRTKEEVKKIMEKNS